MKIVSFFSFMVAVGFSIIPIKADTTTPSTTPPPHIPMIGKTVLQHQKEPSKRPNAPSRISIECFYGEDYIEFVFPEGVESMAVIISNPSDEWSGMVMKNNPILNIPIFEGDYSITCTTDDGRTFIGNIVF